MEQKLRISLAAARVNADMTQKRAADELGINVNTLQNYESGKTCPSWEIICKMEAIYGIPVDNLKVRRGVN